MNWIYKQRRPLINTIKAIRKGKLTIGFIGGSITDGRGYHNWPEPVAAWFVENFPKVEIALENAAIGATRSDLAVFRVQRDLIDRGCDLIFVEYAANDADIERIRRHRMREGLFRKLLCSGDRDVVAVYTFVPEMYEEMINNRVPETIADFEVICQHYGTGSVWMSRYAMDEVLKGRIRWEEWLPDGIHPMERGSLSYAASVIAYLEKELSNLDPISYAKEDFPEPIDPLNWERTGLIPFDRVEKTGPWLIKRSIDSVWMDQILSTSAPGSKIRFEFEARGLAIGFDFGKRSSEVKYGIDGGETTTTRFERYEWVPDSGMFLLRLFADGLEAGCHTFEMEAVHGNFKDCGGTRCDIAFIGMIC